MTVEQTALFNVEEQKLSLLEGESDPDNEKYVDHIVELAEPSEKLEAKMKIVKVIKLDDAGDVETEIDGTRIFFSKVASNLDPMLTPKLLVAMLQGRTFRTER